MRGVIPFNDEHFMLIGYSAKGGVNVELKVDFDKAGHGSIPARESAITILTKGNFHNLRCNTAFVPPKVRPVDNYRCIDYAA